MEDGVNGARGVNAHEVVVLEYLSCKESVIIRHLQQVGVFALEKEDATRFAVQIHVQKRRLRSGQFNVQVLIIIRITDSSTRGYRSLIKVNDVVCIHIVLFACLFYCWM